MGTQGVFNNTMGPLQLSATQGIQIEQNEFEQIESHYNNQKKTTTHANQGNINFYDGLVNDASSARSRSENPNSTNPRGSMVHDESGRTFGAHQQFLNLKNAKRSISNDNNNNTYNKKSI